MTNKKTTKKALLASLLSLVLCCAMLIGTTFAWFTDSVTSGNNKIVAGNLDVQLLMYDEDTKEYANISDTTASIFGGADSLVAQNDNADTLWEPGKTQVVYLAIKNNGNLALKYQVALNVKNPVNGKDLYKAMEYTITPDATKDEVTAWDDTNAKTVAIGTQMVSNGSAHLQKGETHYFALSVHMMEEAGNEYQNGQIDFDLTVLATQLASEEDSFDNQYDAEAWYDLQKDESGAYLLYCAEDLMAFNKKMNEPGLNGEGNPFTVKLMADVDMSSYEWLSINEMFLTFDGNGHTISNLNCIENGNKSGFFGYLGGGKIQNLTLENVTSVGSQAGIFAGQSEGSDIINCNVAGENYVAWDDDSNDAITKNGIGIYVGVSVESNEISGTIKKGANTVMNSTGMSEAASGVWTTNDKYAGGLYTESQTINVKDEGAVAELTLVSEGLYQDTNKEYYVDAAAGLSALNSEWKTYANKATVINLLDNIDFTGYTWTPVDSHADGSSQLKEINGNGYTISNLTINGQAMFTRFAGTGDVTVKDITFDNAKVNSSAINSSILTVQTYQNVLLDNVDVTNSTITGTYKVAPLIATVYNESSSTVTATLKNCDVTNCIVKATQVDFCTAGLVAFVYAGDNDKIEFENCTVTNVTLIAPDDSYDAHAFVYTTGSKTLYNEAEGVTVTNCKFEPLN